MSVSVNVSAPLVTADFDAVTSGNLGRKKRPSPLSVRLSPEQRKQLECDAQGMALNAYVISKLFNPRRKRRLNLARIAFGRLSRSNWLSMESMSSE